MRVIFQVLSGIKNMSALLNDLTQQYQTATLGWYTDLFPLANHLFGVLAILELAWSGIWWAVEKSDISSLWAEFLKKLVVIGFFYAILLHAQSWVPAIIKSFMLAGSSASHIQKLDPNSIFMQGIQLAQLVMVPLHDQSLLSAGFSLLVGYTTALVIIVAFALIAGELVISLIESYLIVGAGILFLGFSFNRFTQQFALNYLRYAISIGAKLFMLYLIIGVGAHLATAWSDLLQQSSHDDMIPFFEVMGGSLVFVFIAWTIPHKAESLLSGSSSASFAGLYAATTTVNSVAKGAVGGPAKMAGHAMGSGMEALKQANTILKQTGSIDQAIIKTAGNVAASTLGRATGRHRSVYQAMADKTKQLHKNKPS
jgi:type IV secretion system protein TrbL